VISLAFGVLFASVVTLVMVTCAYVSGHSVGQRIKHLIGWAMNKLEMSAPSVDIKPNTVSEKKTS
jgi:uncharacterized protein (UPF0333 family)